MTAVVETTGGTIEGFARDGLKVFLGVPFAAPPSGDRRWRAPQPVEPWQGRLETRAFGPTAPLIMPPPNAESPLQTAFKVDPELGVQPRPGEDCLYLNVWTPGLDDRRRPVMVWIHGGGFTGGSGSSPVYNGAVLAARGDVVVVTVNYRLNVFGFLRLKDITDGSIPSTGNEGLLDQVMALQWVRDNIAAFGGEPGNVTIFGESAGAGSVAALLGMPAARGLFHKAIAQSGSASFLSAREEANGYAEHFLRVTGLAADDAGSLRGLTMKQALAAWAKSLPVPRGIRAPMPVVDGEVFPEMPIDSIRAGSADGIPLLAGTMTDEWRLWQAMDPAIAELTEGRMLGRFTKMMPEWDAAPMAAAYRKLLEKRGVPTTPAEVYLAIMTARMFWIPTLRMLEAQRNRGNPAYAYMMDWESPAAGGIFGACHAMDIGFLWGAHQTDFYGIGPAADTLSARVQDAWLAFARGGAPGCEGLGQWPAYGQRRETMMLGEQCGITYAPQEEERLLWDGVPDDALKWG